MQPDPFTLTREDYRTVVRQTSVLWFDSDSKWVLLTVILIGLIVDSLVFRQIEKRTLRRWGMQAH